MVQLAYDIIRHNDGWAIIITPSQSDAFPTKQDAFDAASEHARKLRFAGFSLGIRTGRPAQRETGTRRSS